VQIDVLEDEIEEVLLEHSVDLSMSAIDPHEHDSTLKMESELNQTPLYTGNDENE